jgi:hypothetical protein
MPPLPFPVAPVAEAPAGAPRWANHNDAMAYVLKSFQTMGEKGQRIGTEVLPKLGITNANQLKPEQYEQLFQLIEALKAS